MINTNLMAQLLSSVHAKAWGHKLYHLIKPKLIEAGIKLGREGFFDYLRKVY